MKARSSDFFWLFSTFSLMLMQLAESVCVIKYPDDIAISPIYAKVLGLDTMYLPYNGKDLILYDGETVQGYCRTNFTSITLRAERSRYRYSDFSDQIQKSLVDQSSLNFNCVDGELRANNLILQQTVFACNKLNWTVYNSNEACDWCEKNENSKTFLLAAKSSINHHILAGICFNLKEWSLQTITYNVSSSSAREINKEMQRDITKTHLKGFQSLGDEFWNLKNNYFDFTEIDLTQQLAELSHTNPWLILANYELSSVVQGEFFINYFNEFVGTLNIIWWRNLRMGNWKNFMGTLKNYVYSNSFQIYTGTSGAVKIPSKHPAENNILQIQNGYLNKTVPGYIWSYLTSNDGHNDDFIIVGYNSPFAEWFGISDIVFCPDICSQIPWLKQINSSFRYATAGVLLRRAAQKQANLLKIEDVSKNTIVFTDLEATEQTGTEKEDAAEYSITNWSDILNSIKSK